MSDDLNELYQAIILDHSKHPHNARVIAPCTHSAEGYNPLCGDEVTVYCTIEGGLVADVSFMGQGCAISKASASLMTLQLKGKTLEEAGIELDWVTGMLTGSVVPERSAEAVGDLVALAGVRQFPARIKCATLAWHAFEAALKGNQVASTE